MRVAVVMDDQDTLDSAAHPIVLVVVLQTLKTRGNTWILFWLRFLSANTERTRVTVSSRQDKKRTICAYVNVKFERGYLAVRNRNSVICSYDTESRFRMRRTGRECSTCRTEGRCLGLLLARTPRVTCTRVVDSTRRVDAIYCLNHDDVWL